MSDGCSSCPTSAGCDLIMGDMTNGCPCADCIVKVTCMELDLCDKYREFYELKFGFDPGDQKGGYL